MIMVHTYTMLIPQITSITTKMKKKLSTTLNNIIQFRYNICIQDEGKKNNFFMTIMRNISTQLFNNV